MTMFVMQSNKWQTRKLIKKLENNYMCGTDGYPTDMVQAFKILNKFKQWQPPMRAPDVTKMAFAQKGGKMSPVCSDNWIKMANCHHCGRLGHIKPQCPNLQLDHDANDDEEEEERKPAARKCSDSKGKKEKGKKKTTFPQCHSLDDLDNDDDDNTNTHGF